MRKQLITLMLGSTELETETLIVKNTNNYWYNTITKYPHLIIAIHLVFHSLEKVIEHMQVSEVLSLFSS